MKIVYIGCRSLDGLGGIETYMRNLLPILVKRGFEVVLYVEGKRYEKKIIDGVSVISFPSIQNKFLNKIINATISTLYSIIKDNNVDVYHYNAIPAAFFSVIPILLKHVVVYQGHGFEWKRKKWSKTFQRLIKFGESFVIKINKNITMVSDEQSVYIKTYNKYSKTITPGVDIVYNSNIDNSFLKKYGLEENGYILYLGRLVPEKKADLLIDAFNQLENNCHKLVIAGDDQNELKYKSLLREASRFNKNIIFTGAVYGNEKEALLRYCKIFCIPSEMEGLPITLLEAMSYSKICLASNIQANIEAMDKCGFYFEVNNKNNLIAKLETLLLSDLQYDEVVKCAKDRVEKKFSWSYIADSFISYYKSIS